MAAAVLAGCASGQQFTPGDGPGGGQADSAAVSPDAALLRDAPMHDAHVPPDAFVYEDARPIDAFVYHDAPPCTPHTTELLANPAFDLSPTGTGWVQQPIDTTYPDITSAGVTQSAPNAVWLGGIPSTGPSLTDIVYQDVAVPANTTQLVLTGYYVVGTTELSSGVVDTGAFDLVQTNGTPIENVLSLTNLTNTSSFTSVSHTFTANVSGQTVRLRMTSTNRGDGTGVDYTNFFFDTLSLKATHCP